MTKTDERPSRRRFIVPAIVAAALIGGFGLIADEVLEGETVAFDTTVTSWFRAPGSMNEAAGPIWLQEAGRDVTALGSFSVLGLIVIAAVAYYVLAGKRATALFVALAVISGTVLSNTLKAIFDRPRPDVEAATRTFTASFPSGHSTLSAVVYLTLGVLLAQSAKNPSLKGFFLGLSIFLTFWIGISRIYEGVHYPTDVIAGWSLGTAWAIVCWVGYDWMIRRARKLSPASPSPHRATPEP